MRMAMLGMALTAAVAGSGAEAATISFSGSTSGSGIQTIELGWFDTTLGTLTSALFEFDAFASANDSALAFDGETVSASTKAQVTVSFAGVSFSDTAVDSVSCTAPIPGDCLAFAQAFAFLRGSGVVDPANFAIISGTGTGTVFATVSLLTFNDFSDSGAEVSVTYTYDPAIVPIPLPAAGVLLVAGLGGLALLRRRRAA